jgi:HK97 family phage major capsid protein
MKSIQDLRAERSDLAKKARNHLDNWGKDTKAQVDEIYAAIDAIDGQIETIEKQLKIEAGVTAAIESTAQRRGVSTDEAAHVVALEKDIFRAFLLGGREAVMQLGDEHQAILAQRRREIRADQSATTGSAGGFLVPREIGDRILQNLAAYGGAREVATILRTDHGRPIDYPTTDVSTEEGELVAENVAASADAIVFGTTAIGAYKYSSKIVNVPIELLQDQAFDIEGHLQQRFTDRLGRITNKHFTTGTGTGQPQGMVTASAVGKTGATGQTTSVTYADLVDLEHSVDPIYRGNAGFMFHDLTLRALKKLVDSQGRPLWRPGVTGGDANDILGYRYTINQAMPVMAANAKSILFGDFSKYVIRDVMAMQLFRFADSKYLEKGQIAFLAWMRSDGRLMDQSNAALKHYANSAT